MSQRKGVRKKLALEHAVAAADGTCLLPEEVGRRARTLTPACLLGLDVGEFATIMGEFPAAGRWIPSSRCPCPATISRICNTGRLGGPSEDSVGRFIVVVVD